LERSWLVMCSPDPAVLKLTTSHTARPVVWQTGTGVSNYVEKW